MTITIQTVENEHMLQEAFSVRKDVFVREQEIPEEIELDEYDRDAKTIHILARDASGHAVGTARLRPYHGDSTGKIERVAVLHSVRGAGLGKQLMIRLEAEAVEAGFPEVRLNAQIQARGFYEHLGYEPVGELFFEAGIEHIAMRKTLQQD